MNRTTNQLVEAAILSSLTILLAIGAYYIPALGGVLYFAVPVPVIILARRNGAMYATLSVIVSTFTIFMALSVVNGISVGILLGIPAIIIGTCMHRGKVAYWSVLAGSFATMIALMLLTILLQQITGIPLMDTIKEGVMFQIDATSKIYDSLPGATAEQIELAKTRLKAATDQTLLLFPVFMLMYSFISCIINYTIAEKMLKRLRNPIPHLPHIMLFKLPKNAPLGILIILVLTYIITTLHIVDEKILTANVVVLAQFIFFIQGLAVIFFYMHFKKFSTFLGTMVIVFVMLSGFGLLFLSMVGMTDTIIDFRRKLVIKAQK